MANSCEPGHAIYYRLRASGECLGNWLLLWENSTTGSGFSPPSFLPDCAGSLCHHAAKSPITTKNSRYKSFTFPFCVENISPELAFSPKPVNQRMTPATAHHIEYPGALPDLFFGGVIFDFNFRRTVVVARWTRNLDDVALLFHDFVWFDFGKKSARRLNIRGHDTVHSVMPQPR